MRLDPCVSMRVTAVLAGIVFLVACSEGSPTAESDTQAATTGDVAAGVAEVTPPNAISDVVPTRSGLIRGETIEDGGKSARIFRGVPYAAPPIGELRWKAPQPPASWEGVRDATQWADRCPQRRSPGFGGISEDCLYLNVVTAAKTRDDRLPVMVFFHGGGLTTGTANSEVYNHPALANKGVVLVTVNSRLGPIGYMAHPALSAESERGASGNYGTLDLRASLEWVQANAAAFGGDPGNVLIFGESGGGTKTISQLASPQSAGLFTKAVIQSGSSMIMPDRVLTLAESEALGEKIAAKLGVDGEADVLAALRAKPFADVLEAAGDEAVGFRANLTVDGWALPQSVPDMFAAGKQADVPIVVGANSGEKGHLEETVPALAAAHAATASSPVYVYNFSHVPAGWKSEGCVAFHGIEIPYVFGAIPDGLTVPTILALSRRGGCRSRDPGTDAADLDVAEKATTLWTQFAKTGSPSVAGTVEWPAYTKEADRYLDIGTALEVKSGIAQAYVAPPAREDEDPAEE